MTQLKERVKIGVVIHQPLRDRLFTPADQERLNALGTVIWAEQKQPLTPGEAVALLAECRIGIGSWGTPFPAPALLEACPQLELWEHVAGSVKHMFGTHLSGKRLTIASCKPALADLVAEMTLGQIILGLRGVFPNAVANRNAIAAPPANIRVLYGATIGIIGASLIGRRMIALLRPFGCRVLVYDPYLSSEAAAELGAELWTDLAALCACCDVVSLHTPDLPETRHIMGAAEFKAMRDAAIFINTARGNCVDEAALIAELSCGRLFAFLDVSMPEPAVADSPFRRLPNVVYTSHIAGPVCFKLGNQAVADVEAFVNGQAPAYVTTSEMLAVTA